MSKLDATNSEQHVGKETPPEEQSTFLRDGCGGTHELSLTSLPGSDHHEVLRAACDLTDQRQRPSLPFQPQDLLLWTRCQDIDIAVLRSLSTVQLAQLAQVSIVLNHDFDLVILHATPSHWHHCRDVVHRVPVTCLLPERLVLFDLRQQPTCNWLSAQKCCFRGPVYKVSQLSSAIICTTYE